MKNASDCFKQPILVSILIFSPENNNGDFQMVRKNEVINQSKFTYEIMNFQNYSGRLGIVYI